MWINIVCWYQVKLSKTSDLMLPSFLSATVEPLDILTGRSFKEAQALH